MVLNSVFLLNWLPNQNKKKCPICYSWGRIDEFIPFLRALVWSEMQTVSSRIWTLIIDSISYDGYYSKCASIICLSNYSQSFRTEASPLGDSLVSTLCQPCSTTFLPVEEIVYADFPLDWTCHLWLTEDMKYFFNIVIYFFFFFFNLFIFFCVCVCI